MNVENGAEAAQFPEKEYINGIAVAEWSPTCFVHLVLYTWLVNVLLVLWLAGVSRTWALLGWGECTSAHCLSRSRGLCMLKQCFLEKLLAFCRLLHRKILYYRWVSPRKTHINAYAEGVSRGICLGSDEWRQDQTNTHIPERKNTKVTL